MGRVSSESVAGQGEPVVVGLCRAFLVRSILLSITIPTSGTKGKVWGAVGDSY
jgi:hypothetical protein